MTWIGPPNASALQHNGVPCEGDPDLQDTIDHPKCVADLLHLHGFVVQENEGLVQHQGETLALRDPPVGGGMRFWSECAAPAGQREKFVLMCLGS